MTHDPREALEIVQQMIRGKPMEAWITDIRTMKSLGDVVQETLTAAAEGEQRPVAHRIRVVYGSYCKIIPEGELEIWKQNWSTHLKSGHALLEPLYLSPPPAAGCPDWGQIVQSLLRSMDATVKNEGSRDQAVRMADDLCNKYPALRRAAPAPEGVVDELRWPANLHPNTLNLVKRFAVALAKKLRLAEEKYGYGDGWADGDWETVCREHLYRHLDKGDPRDVGAYCAFMWHHGWITSKSDADELTGCREALRKEVIKTAKQDAMISDLNDMVLRYAHRVTPSRPDAGGGVREQLAEALAENKALRAANTQLVLAERDRIEAALSTPPAAAESNASVEARLREALEKIAGSHWERIGHCQTDVDDVPNLTAQEAMREARKALSTVGDEARKSESGVDWDDVRGIAPNATGDLSSEAFIREQRDSWDDKYSDPTAERREIMARIIEERAVQIHIREHSCPPDLTNETHRWAMHRIRQELNTFADAILAALDGGAGE